MSFTTKIADKIIYIDNLYEETKEFFKDYLIEEKPCEFHITCTPDDIDNEQEQCTENTFSPSYLETLAILRKLAELFPLHKCFLMHGACIAYENKAYLFTAPSGTGKSTHTRLWREMLGDKAVMINDDKPIIRYIDGEFFVYGTPWMGKHNLGANVRAKLKAICKIRQEKENTIENITPAEMLVTILNQTLRPEKLDNMDKLLAIIDKMLEKAKLYSLGCNISLEAAELSYKTMVKEENYED